MTLFEHRGDEQVFDIERLSLSNGYLAAPNERADQHQPRTGIVAVSNFHMRAAQVPDTVFDHAAKRYLRRIDEPSWFATTPEHHL